MHTFLIVDKDFIAYKQFEAILYQSIACQKLDIIETELSNLESCVGRIRDVMDKNSRSFNEYNILLYFNLFSHLEFEDGIKIESVYQLAVQRFLVEPLEMLGKAPTEVVIFFGTNQNEKQEMLFNGNEKHVDFSELFFNQNGLMCQEKCFNIYEFISKKSQEKIEIEKLNDGVSDYFDELILKLKEESGISNRLHFFNSIKTDFIEKLLSLFCEKITMTIRLFPENYLNLLCKANLREIYISCFEIIFENSFENRIKTKIIEFENKTISESYRLVFQWIIYIRSSVFYGSLENEYHEINYTTVDFVFQNHEIALKEYKKSFEAKKDEHEITLKKMIAEKPGELLLEDEVWLTEKFEKENFDKKDKSSNIRKSFWLKDLKNDCLEHIKKAESYRDEIEIKLLKWKKTIVDAYREKKYVYSNGAICSEIAFKVRENVEYYLEEKKLEKSHLEIELAKQGIEDIEAGYVEGIIEEYKDKVTKVTGSILAFSKTLLISGILVILSGFVFPYFLIQGSFLKNFNDWMVFVFQILFCTGGMGLSYLIGYYYYISTLKKIRKRFIDTMEEIHGTYVKNAKIFKKRMSEIIPRYAIVSQYIVYLEGALLEEKEKKKKKSNEIKEVDAHLKMIERIYDCLELQRAESKEENKLKRYEGIQSGEVFNLIEDGELSGIIAEVETR